MSTAMPMPVYATLLEALDALEDHLGSDSPEISRAKNFLGNLPLQETGKNRNRQFGY